MQRCVYVCSMPWKMNDPQLLLLYQLLSFGRICWQECFRGLHKPEQPIRTNRTQPYFPVSIEQSLYNQMSQYNSEQFLILMAESTQLLSYRNGFYQGQLKHQARHGYGIMIRDDGALIVGQWKNDLTFGKGFVILNSEQYGYVDFNRGELDGNCYFRGEKEMLFGPFRAGKPIDRLVSANFYQNKAKIIAFRNISYQTLKEFNLQENNDSVIIQKYLGLNVYIPPPVQYLQKEFCNEHLGFQLQYLQNGNAFFRYRQKGNPHSLGFVLGTRNQVLAYGMYLEGKLHGFGCKVDNSGKYEGQFQAGQLNGYGMVLSNGRYSFGGFNAGKLVEPIHLEERSSESQAKLKQLKRQNHIQSNFFLNNYISKEIMKFKGISEVTSVSSSYLKDFLYDQSKPNTQLTSSNLKGSNVSLNKFLSSRMEATNDHRSLFQSSQVSRSRVVQQREWEERRWMANNLSSEQGRRFGV